MLRSSSKTGLKKRWSKLVATRLLHLAGMTQKRECLKPGEKRLKTWYWVRMVAHTGFEPVISALRGRCPRPLDECAMP
jgi:hypothetical protein